jgi:hypothetical protein
VTLSDLSAQIVSEMKQCNIMNFTTLTATMPDRSDGRRRSNGARKLVRVNKDDN